MPQPFLVTPGSELVKKTIERDGYMEDFNKVGALVLANACGPLYRAMAEKSKKRIKPTPFSTALTGTLKAEMMPILTLCLLIASPEVVYGFRFGWPAGF